MFRKDKLEEIEKEKEAWEGGTLKRSLERFGIEASPNQFYSPLDIKDHVFLDKVGFPGEYPYTSDIYPSAVPSSSGRSGAQLVRAGGYSGYGTAEDTRDYYQYMASKGRRGGPNVAFDLPTQCGYDSDDPQSKGEVGKVGVAVDTLQDFETIFEAFTGPMDLDKIASNFTINAPANIIIAMYIALAEKRGIPVNRLRGTPQNDILKEYLARGTYIFPPQPSVRMIRDTITYCTEHVPLMNTISICGYHIREAGATGPQTVAFTFSNGIAYTQLGVDAGLDVDAFVPRFTFLGFGGSMDFFGEIALHRAARRIWAKIMRERFGAEKPRSWLLRGGGGGRIGNVDTTIQRPLNNHTRSVLGGIASAISGGPGNAIPSYDEPLGLGHSMEAAQLMIDATRIINEEAKLCDVTDPLAGSYYVEWLTDKMEAETREIIEKIDSLGGAVAAIERGYMQEQIAGSAYDTHKDIQSGKKIQVGVNAFTGEHELEVVTNRLVPYPYDPEKRELAEEKQIAKLGKVRRQRDNVSVEASLKRLKEAARDEDVNLIPVILEAVKTYATIGEMCNALREIFGEYESYGAVL
jgi:methylmalonyl-CoA mutase N-terminal domain/subunit